MRSLRLSAVLVLVVLAGEGMVAQNAPQEGCDGVSARRAACSGAAQRAIKPLGLGWGSGSQECVDGGSGCHPTN